MGRAISLANLKTGSQTLLCCLALIAWGALPPAAQAQTGDWTWMGGSSAPGQNGVYGTMGTPAAANIPGGRIDAVTWTDSTGNLWLFGGYGAVSVGGNFELNDLWEFNPSTGEWVWISGSNMVPNTIPGPPGVYGSLGQPAAGNVPGGRSGAVGWIDSKGNQNRCAIQEASETGPGRLSLNVSG